MGKLRMISRGSSLKHPEQSVMQQMVDVCQKKFLWFRSVQGYSLPAGVFHRPVKFNVVRLVLKEY